MGHAADLHDAHLKACLVARKVFTDLHAVSVAQEGSNMFASAARAGIVNDRSKFENWLVAKILNTKKT
jgi:hypothetical protein